MVANIPRNANEHTARRRGPIHRARTLALSKTCISITKYVFLHYQICVSIPRFVGVYIYAGTINRPLQLLTDCDNVANIPRNAHENTRNTQRTPTKCPTKHTARRRGRFIAPVSLYYQIYIFVSPNTCIYITITHFRSPFRGCLRIRGTINRSPYSC